MPVVELVARLRRRELDPAGVMEACLERIEAGRDLNAFLWADPERALAMCNRRREGGEALSGLPLALKDNIDTAGIPTTAGSLVDLGRVPGSDAPVWARLRDHAGANLLGKAHLCEFAYRSHHPALGRVRNPRNPARATGGSSSGSAAAVAAGLAPAARGPDTGGSVRIPAAYCGVVGFKGTPGLVETSGVVPLSPTMDVVGVLAASVADAAAVLQEMAPGPAALLGPGSLSVPEVDPRRLRVGVGEGYLASRAQPAVLRTLERAARLLEAAGCRAVPVSLPRAGRWRQAHRTLLLQEAWAFHRERLAAGAPYGPVFRKAITAGGGISPGRYREALAERERAASEMASAFGDFDVLLTPTCPTVAPPEETGRGGVDYTRYTTLASFAGLPAVSIPAGTGHLGLPVGVQLMAAAGRDALLVRAAALLEALLA
ncbi:MAG: amidase [Candidatus Dormibacterales bacterium]